MYAKNQPLKHEVAPKVWMSFHPDVTATWTTATRPTNPRWGEVGLNTETGCIEVWSPLVNGGWRKIQGTPVT